MTACALALVLPSAAFAQAAIAGLVKDTSGAVLPGVTVEASSPALIEKTRSVVTDGNGLFRVVDLRPGVYTVTFTLTGFNTVKRDGIELTGSFTATVNADLRVGAVEETITVTGESPVVDTQSAAQQRVMSKEVVDASPTGRTHFEVATLIPGVQTSNTTDSGGTNAIALVNLTSHGSRTGDSRVTINGLSTQNAETSGNSSGVLPNISGTQEITVDFAAGSAEMPNGGVRINVIPRDGGNTFKGTFFANGTKESWQNNNLSADLKARGLLSANTNKLQYDVNPGIGGPIIRDRLWFFAAARWNGNQNYVGGVFWNKDAYNPNVWTYTPDLTRPGVFRAVQRSVAANVTWQYDEKNKFNFLWDQQYRCQCTRPNVNVSPEAADTIVYPYRPFASASWSAPMTSRLLLEAGYSYRPEKWYYPRFPEQYGQPTLDMPGVIEQSTGLAYRAQSVGQSQVTQPDQITEGIVNNYRASMSYVTGSHSFKFGFGDSHSSRTAEVRDDNVHVVYRFNNGIPNQITEKATPYSRKENIGADLGIYVQDRWTVKKLTLNAGVRFDYFNDYFPAQHLGPGLLVPNRNVDFPRIPWVSWKDVTPRLAAVYDLFGDGKTAVKVSLNKYMIGFGLQGDFGNNANPINRSAINVTRSWNDANRDYIPQCDLTNTLANGECGAMSDQNFGKPTLSTNYDKDTLVGWGKRGYNWEFSLGMQHELLPGVSVNAAYFRRAYGNFTVTDNLAAAATDYSTYSIVAPTDSRLPNGGGQPITGLKDLNPDKVGQVNNYFTFANNFGDQVEYWHGVDLSANTRLARGILLQGGLSTGRTVTDNCDVLAKLPELAPQGLPYCRQTTKFLTQVKAVAAYTIPKVGLQVSATLQSNPGPVITASYVASNAIIAPSLGRNLSANAANATINLVAPGTLYGERSNEIDMRLSKAITVSGLKTSFSLDVFNVLNENAVLALNSNYATWQRPQSIMYARFMKLGVQIDF
ncbi:MAG: carboxypeptidase regulatory-like domain-containing protein [Vicinamibacterales bacterium]